MLSRRLTITIHRSQLQPYADATLLSTYVVTPTHNLNPPFTITTICEHHIVVHLCCHNDSQSQSTVHNHNHMRTPHCCPLMLSHRLTITIHRSQSQPYANTTLLSTYVVTMTHNHNPLFTITTICRNHIVVHLCCHADSQSQSTVHNHNHIGHHIFDHLCCHADSQSQSTVHNHNHKKIMRTPHCCPLMLSHRLTITIHFSQSQPYADTTLLSTYVVTPTHNHNPPFTITTISGHHIFDHLCCHADSQSQSIVHNYNHMRTPHCCPLMLSHRLTISIHRSQSQPYANTTLLSTYVVTMTHNHNPLFTITTICSNHIVVHLCCHADSQSQSTVHNHNHIGHHIFDHLCCHADSQSQSTVHNHNHIWTRHF